MTKGFPKSNLKISMPPVRKYERYKYVLLNLNNDLKVSLDMMSAGHSIDTSIITQVLDIVVEQLNKEAENGWKLYSWALQPVPHIFLEKEK